jgi:subfamily B ATP-binding cassette protein MsbA
MDSQTTVSSPAPRILASPDSTGHAVRQRPRLQVWRLVQPYWKALALALVAVMGETVADVLEPWPIKLVIDNVVQSKPLPPWLSAAAGRFFSPSSLQVLNLAVTACALIALVGAVSTYAEQFLTTNVAQWVGHDLRRTLYHHIQRLSLAEHDETRSGDLVSRITDDITAVQDFLKSALLGIFVNVLTLAGMVGVMFWMNWRFTLIALAITPILFLVVYFFTKRIKAASRTVRKKESAMLSDVTEVLTSIRVVQAFAREDYEERKFESESLDNVKAGLRARTLKATLPPIVDVLVAVGTCLVLAYGGRLVLGGKISPGMLIVFVMYLSRMYKPMRDLSKMTDTVSKASVGYERIREVLEIDSRVRDRAGARRAPRFKGALEFDRVNFDYGDGAVVLKDVSFRVEPGQVAAIVGASGAGKSTIASLIPRFYDPASGAVKIDGVDLRRYTLKSLRQQISLVLQDTVLFRTTIAENIAYGNPTATPRDIERAARLANAAEFIDELPAGYDTMVGERGVSLSGGQRQRIAIARAIVRDTPFLVLDEPTASLDAESEQSVFEALKRLMEARTCVVIAHHLATIKDADVIFVLQDAHLVEQGTHDQLIAGGGPYAKLHELQTTQQESAH